jgi:hypothetical protein
MQTWITWIRDPQTGASIKVSVQAGDPGSAKALFEMQYGKDNVLHLPTPA